ncbi:MAG: sensor histidine kinase, partial [Shimia sp.]
GQAADEAEGLARTFDALLQIARIEGGAAPAPVPVDLGEVVRTVHDLWAAEAEGTGHDLRLEAGPAEALGDRTLLAQAVSNLVENALRHTPPGTAVVVGAAGARLWVEDGGPGIPEDERDKVTRRLYRLDRSRSTPGSGLGLGLVAAIAAHLGGRLALEPAAPGLRATLHLVAPKNGAPPETGD